MNKKWLQKTILLSTVMVYLLGSTVQADTLGTVTVSVLNVRSNPSTSSPIISKTYLGEKVSILSAEGDWYKIKLSNNKLAYVSSDFVKKTTSAEIKPLQSAPSTTNYGYVNVPILNLRASNSLSSNIIGKLTQRTQVSILGTEGDWYKVKTEDHQIGYAFGTYIDSSKPSSSSSGDVRSQVVTYAKQFLGNPYVFGGNSLTNGIDCSAFTQQILRKYGYSISRTSYTQINDGTRITAGELLPGDLVFYGFSGVISHVGMYIGDGKIIHASSPSTGILISGLYTQGKKPYIGSVRIIE
ncbi:MAG: hypothetical protein CVU84_07185 [Firmicutes bacterium HGW-Firmicutes-1]|jgi:cell wall-associated NlpC family hydrolase|nr:MAG: hypothetical protein CVU84_07185 [Firmicutes bacterium HGW-Firmicutes-1]